MLRVLLRAGGVVLVLAVVLVGAEVARRNSAPVDVDFLAGKLVGVRLFWLVLGAFGAGFVLALALASVELLRLRLLARRYRRLARSLEAEVHQLRSLPLAEETGGGASGQGGRPERGR